MIYPPVSFQSNTRRNTCRAHLAQCNERNKSKSAAGSKAHPPISSNTTADKGSPSSDQ